MNDASQNSPAIATALPETPAPRLTLTKVHYSAALSEETAAFTATVCWDGKPFAFADNHGTGGSTSIQPAIMKTPADRELAVATIKEVEAYAAALPKITASFNGADGTPFTYQPDLESMVDDALEDWIAARELKRLLRLNRVEHQPANGPKVVLNDIPVHQAVAIFRKGTDLWKIKARPAPKAPPVTAPTPPVTAPKLDHPGKRSFDI